MYEAYLKGEIELEDGKKNKLSERSKKYIEDIYREIEQIIPYHSPKPEDQQDPDAEKKTVESCQAVIDKYRPHIENNTALEDEKTKELRLAGREVQNKLFALSNEVRDESYKKLIRFLYDLCQLVLDANKEDGVTSAQQNNFTRSYKRTSKLIEDKLTKASEKSGDHSQDLLDFVNDLLTQFTE